MGGADLGTVLITGGASGLGAAVARAVAANGGTPVVLDVNAPVDGVEHEGEIRTPEYPLALWRIHHALELERIGDVVATTRLTYEVTDLVDESHRGGGEHGSLHVQDSQVPFLSTLDEPPLHPSTIDVAPHIIRHFRRTA